MRNRFINFCLCAAITVVAGCSSTTWTEGNVRVTARRFLLSSSAAVTYELGSNDVKRITFSGASKGDSDLARSIARGVVEGALAGRPPLGGGQ